jgi:hypothetical protein
MYIGTQVEKQLTGTQSTSTDNGITRLNKHERTLSYTCWTRCWTTLEQIDVQSADQRLTLCYILAVAKLKHELIECLCHLLQSKALVLWGG